jgi:Carbohydrate family 9 binding domain-like
MDYSRLLGAACKPCLLVPILFGYFLMAQPTSTSECAATGNQIVATFVSHELNLDTRHPAPEWQSAKPVTFCADWQGKNADPGRETRVRVLWTPRTLYLRFECRYREIFVFEDSDPNGRRDQLWDRDVAEAFLQPDPSRPRYYKEFEVSPNGFWIDLDVSPGPLQDLKSGMRSSVWLDKEGKTWEAELAIPMKALTGNFDAAAVWRTNFFRVEGPKEPRFYSAWQATHTPEPAFHVPSAFGYLRFAR